MFSKRILCQLDYYIYILMDSVLRNFNLLTLVTQLILHMTILVQLYCEVNYMWWVNQYLGLQEWEDCIKPNKTRILSIVILLSKIKPQGYK